MRVRSMGLVFLFLVNVAILHAAPVHLRCDYRENPLGIDDSSPQLSCQSNNRERSWRQTAYRIVVASTPDQLWRVPDVWEEFLKLTFGVKSGDQRRYASSKYS